MDDQNRNLLLAIALSFLVIVTWTVLFPPPEPPPVPTSTTASGDAAPVTPAASAPAAGTGAGAIEGGAVAAGDGTAATEAARVAIDTPRLSGSIHLLGARLDDLALKDYRVSLDPGAPTVQLLTRAGTPGAQYALQGWSSADGAIPSDDLPGPNTVWTLAKGETLTPGTPVTLSWTSPSGLAFTREISVDEDFLFTVTDRVANPGEQPAAVYAYGVVERQGIPPDIRNFFILHEGIVAMTDGILEALTYNDMQDETTIPSEGGPAVVTEVVEGGWIGFTDHYWQTILVPGNGQRFTAVAKYLPQQDLYRTSVRLPPVTVAPGGETTVTTHLFAGAKEWEALRDYENDPGLLSQLAGAEADPERPRIDRFVDSIDWGWFFFLTKPIFVVLHWLNALIGNMGFAIIGLTFVIKLIVFPLARKSYISMAKMKELQPELEKLKERAGEDRMKLQKEMMELYKREKVNPAAGCLPILLQIPIFFSLYKVIFVTIELRHAPFVGWIRDLSAPDPSSLWNVWGLMPWAAPEPGSLLATLFIGILPLLLGISMWFQQKLNPAPPDPTQAAIFAWMPWIFMFMLGSFASGLVIYWIANNTITFAQQYLIMWSHGHRPDIFGNIRASFRKTPPPEPPPARKPGSK